MSVRDRVLVLVAALALAGTACTSTDDAVQNDDAPSVIPELVSGEAFDYGPAPVVTEGGDLDPAVVGLLEALASSFSFGFSSVTTNFDNGQLQALVDSGDPRLLWILADLLRFPLEGGIDRGDVADAFEELSGVRIPDGPGQWTTATNHLIAWDTPAIPGYLDVKRALFTTVEPKWDPLFDPQADVDWRHVAWGGVLIDDRAAGNGERCERGCIPALDDPVVTSAGEGGWYPDDAIVFGIELNGETRAYPKNMMEVHELVNDTLGGQRIAVPYCTLCGSAQAYVTDESITMRTSGLLNRSNKMMFDLGTTSLVDTFLGVGTSGPLQGQVFEQVSVATSTWGAWKRSHPDTTILAEDGGIGRSYPADPLRGRDDDGPIFPIGAVDPRLEPQQPVLGLQVDGRAVAIHVDIARATLQRGEPIVVGDLSIELAGDGIRAVRSDGTDAGGHQAFWFAWSQFQPDTALWPLDS